MKTKLILLLAIAFLVNLEAIAQQKSDVNVSQPETAIEAVPIELPSTEMTSEEIAIEQQLKQNKIQSDAARVQRQQMTEAVKKRLQKRGNRQAEAEVIMTAKRRKRAAVIEQKRVPVSEAEQSRKQAQKNN